MNAITFILPCSAKHGDGSKELFNCEGLSICIIYCRLSNFFSRLKLRLKHFKTLKHSHVYPPRFSAGGGKLLPGEGKKISALYVSDIADILTDRIYSRLVLYIDSINQLKYCQSFFYNTASFSISTPPEYTDIADDYIVANYGAAGIVKNNVSYEGKTVISFADSHHTDFNGADYVVCLGAAKCAASIDLHGVFMMPPTSLAFLPPPLRTAPCLEKIMTVAGIGFEGAKVRFVKNNK